LSLAFNMLSLHFGVLHPPEGQQGGDPQQAAQVAALKASAALTSFMATSGQYFGLMFVLLLGIITVTNEFHHQTATATFLATPHRTAVIAAKTAAAGMFGAMLWFVTTLITVPATIIFLHAEGVDPAFGDSAVIRAIGLNLVAYVLWALIGIGIGVLIRSQIGATVTAMVVYTIGTIAVSAIVGLMVNLLHWDWVDNVRWAVPSIASGLMVNGVDLPGQPHYWVGGLVLLAWVVATGLIGTLIMRTRDIS